MKLVTEGIAKAPWINKKPFIQRMALDVCATALISILGMLLIRIQK